MSIIEAPTSKTRQRDLTAEEYREFYSELQAAGSVRDWARRGSPERDVDCMEVQNAVMNLQYRPVYQKLRDRLMEQYGLNEEELIAKVLHRYASKR